METQWAKERRRFIPQAVRWALVVFLTLASGMATAAGDPWLTPLVAPGPADNRTTPQRAVLGKTLFFDPRLSSSNWISCATCHNPAMGWSDGLPKGFGHDMKPLKRATPTIVNAGFSKILMWDGRHKTLEEQALGPIEAQVEMNQDLPSLIAKLSSINGYLALFDKAYPGEGINEKTIGKALAAFQRTVVSTESPFDRWRKGDQKALSASARRGFELFKGKANCAACHDGFNFTDNGFHNIGLKTIGSEEDLGRYAERKVPVMRGAFKTPTLRDLERTAPYMHSGIYRTLEQVVDHYDRGGDVTENLDPNMKPLALADTEKADLVTFLKSLTGKPTAFTVPQLPN
jgi:cytochrome c peroxidase